MIKLYIVCLVVSLLLYFMLYVTDVKRSISQNMMALIMILSNLGYLSFSFAQNLSEAVLANKIIYLGGCFIPMLYFFTVCEICHIDLQKKVKIPMILFQVFTYICVCTIGFNTWYYKSVEFSCVNGANRLIKEYGPMHSLYLISLYGYFVISLVASCLSIVWKKPVNKKEVYRILIYGGVASACYIVQRVLHLPNDIMPISYIILVAGILVPVYHSNLYMVDENKDIISEQLQKVGFITFNRRLEYMGCSDYASDVFTELKDNEVGRPLKNTGLELHVILESLKKYAGQVEKDRLYGHHHTRINSIKKNQRFYDLEIHTLNNFIGSISGFVVEFRDETEHHKIVELTSRYNEELSKEVREKTRRIRDIQEKTILGMAQMVESRDLSTGGHIRRTRDVVRIFSEKLLQSDLGFDEDFLDLVIRSAPMHDLGKIGVDDAILRKQGRFTKEEYEEMKKHAEIGGEMVRNILTGVEEKQFVDVARNVAHYHHEKVDGTGYPDGKKGDEIPVEARIMALADVFDALVSKRCYKDAFSYDKAFSIIKEDAGTHFDKALAEVFLSCRSELEDYYDHCS